MVRVGGRGVTGSLHNELYTKQAVEGSRSAVMWGPSLTLNLYPLIFSPCSSILYSLTLDLCPLFPLSNLFTLDLYSAFLQSPPFCSPSTYRSFSLFVLSFHLEFYTHHVVEPLPDVQWELREHVPHAIATCQLVVELYSKLSCWRRIPVLIQWLINNYLPWLKKK